MLGKALWKEWLGPGCSNNNTGALNYISVAVMKHADHKQLGKKRLIWFMLPGHHPTLREVRDGTQSRNLETVAMEGCCLLAALAGLCSASFLLQSKTVCLIWDGEQWAESSPINPQSRHRHREFLNGESLFLM